MATLAMKPLRAQFALIIEEIHNTLPPDCPLEARVLALEENKPHGLVFHSQWGESRWHEAKIAYLALYGYEKQQENLH